MEEMPSTVLYSWILHYKQLFTKHYEAKLDAPQTQGEYIILSFISWLLLVP